MEALAAERCQLICDLQITVAQQHIKNKHGIIYRQRKETIQAEISTQQSPCYYRVKRIKLLWKQDQHYE